MAARFREFTAVQVRVSIDRIEPQIWRRLVVPLHFNLREFHLVLQAAFGWTHSHLHEFEVGGLSYGNEFADAERTEDGARTFQEMDVRLRDFTREPGTTFRYVYDMGDNWVHTVVLRAACCGRASAEGGAMRRRCTGAAARGRGRPERIPRIH